MSKPDFSHLSLTDKNCGSFHTYMEAKGYKLAEEIYNYGKTWKSWGSCIVCEAEFPANLASHVWGKAHCNKLKEKLNWQEPRDPAHLAQFNQFWKIEGAPKPAYYFNHITGDQGLADLPAEMPAYLAPPPACTGPAQMPGVPAAVPNQEMPAARPANGMLVDHDQSYAKNINQLELWKRQMDKTGEALDRELEKTGRYDHVCAVCTKAMTRGAGDHLKSKNHWSELWKKVGSNMPSPEKVVDLSEPGPWWQEFVIPAGKCRLNHLTGALLVSDPGMSAPLGGSGPPATAPGQPEPEPLAPPSPIGSGGLILDHNHSWRQAWDTKDKWRAFMDQPSGILEQQVPNTWDSPCEVCDKKIMTRGAKDHLQSQNHWKMLWDKMQKLCRDLPPDHVACQMTARPWVQEFQTPSGVYVFNHLTGGQLLRGGAAAASPCPVLARPAAVPAPAPAAAPARPTAPTPSPAAPQIAQAPPANAASLPATRNGLTYREAVQDAGSWKKYMDGPTNLLDNDVYPLMGGATLKCIVCDAGMLAFNTHLCSQKHFKSLWNKLGSRGIPDPSEASVWTAPWVEKIATQRGTYLFNHLTGEQGFEAEVLGGAASPPATAPATARPTVPPANAGTTPPVRVERPPVPPVPCQPTSPPFAPPLAAKGDTEYLLWRCQVRGPAEKMAEKLQGDDDWNAPELHCAMCNQNFDDVKAHLESVEHFSCLKAKLQEAITRLGSLDAVMAQKQEFAQTFDSVAFQHLTLEVMG
mmetsp:Transcript_50138/g.117027  ORF Transcript_50138/g.117027 Transcript_50138/m.117027 type:complete len:749 (-) Transcript_50138:89-2335(-)